MAGLSAAAGLAAVRSVVLVEREPHWAYHSTGRSAALFAESYGNTAVRALTRASREFYLSGEAAERFTRPRGALFVATATQQEELRALKETLADAPRIEILTPDAALALCPALQSDTLAAALFDPDARDIDVAAVVDHYSRLFRARGGRPCRDAEVSSLEPVDDGWQVRAGDREIRAKVVVNAAGAWADEVACAAGVAALGLEPRRRTAVRVSAAPWVAADWPFIVDVSEQWYFRADAGALMLSPALRLGHHAWLTSTHTLIHLDGLALGSLMALGMLTLPLSRRAWLWLGLCGFAGGFAAAGTIAGGTAFLDSALAVGFAGMVLALIVSTGARNPVNAMLRSGPFAFYGRISYGLYMTHISVFIYFGWFDLRMDHYGIAGNLAVVGFRLAVCTAVAAALWYGFESQILKLKKYF